MQQYVQQAVARPDQYELAPVYYASVADAKAETTKRCAALNGAA